jgi:predicted acyl esterase
LEQELSRLLGDRRVDLPIVTTANLFRAGSRIKVRIGGCDDKPTNSMEGLGTGHVRRPSASRVTVHDTEDYPSHLLLPVTSGNIIGTYISGGEPYL